MSCNGQSLLCSVEVGCQSSWTSTGEKGIGYSCALEAGTCSVTPSTHAMCGVLLLTGWMGRQARVSERSPHLP